MKAWGIFPFFFFEKARSGREDDGLGIPEEGKVLGELDELDWVRGRILWVGFGGIS